MSIELSTPDLPRLGEAVQTLGEWQEDGSPIQLHPGDLGWFWRHGAEATAAAVRTWSRDGRLLAVGLLDGSDLLRLAISPASQQDENLARHIAAQTTDPAWGVLPAGPVSVEIPVGALVRDVLGEAGWGTEEPWALLRRDLSAEVEATDLRVEEIGAEAAPDWARVHRAAFGLDPSADERVLRGWHAIASGPIFEDARCLVGYDDRDDAVAIVMVWSAGSGRYGLIEPMGVHPEHRGHGYGRAISLAAAAAMRQDGASASIVCTPTSRVGAVATYRSAGYELLQERHDRRRHG